MLDAAFAKMDGWINHLTRLGTPLDSASATRFERPARLDDEQLSGLYHHDDLSRLVCSIFPREALRRGFGELSPEVEALSKRLRLGPKLAEAAALGRAFGGAIVTVGIAGQIASEPWTTPGEIVWLDVYDRRRVTREHASRVTDPNAPNYGEATQLRVANLSGASVIWHRSRCLVFGGAETAKQEKEGLDGWDFSVLQAIYPILQTYNAAHLAAGNLLSSSSEGVMTIKGLIAAIAGGGRAQFEKRMALLDSTRSVARTVLLDADNGEAYTRVSASFSGIPETIDRFSQRLSVATGIPPIVLGRHFSGGLGDAGVSELRAWYDQVQGYRAAEIEPHVERLLRMAYGDSAPVVEWPSLWQPTDAETSALQLQRAQRDQIYLAAEVVLPEEVAATLGEVYPAADLELREQVPDEEKEIETVDAPTVDTAAQLASEMSGAGLERCEHGRANRCPLCGVERDRGVLPDGSFKRGAWRAIAS